MATNVEVKKNNQESTANLIRRFTKRVQGSGILNRLRKHRYHSREKSPLVHRAKKLVKLGNKVKYETLLKLGKIQETPRGRRR
jgi:ribosomal protein S21